VYYSSFSKALAFFLSQWSHRSKSAIVVKGITQRLPLAPHSTVHSDHFLGFLWQAAQSNDLGLGSVSGGEPSQRFSFLFCTFFFFN
jgi:hypothetical protein